jgi:ATP-binding cassette, subfamily G (WHITE), eye pigment precursor transporter
MKTFSKVGAYVMQDDRLYSSFTPKEALTFAARLKLYHVDKKTQDERVNILLKELGLNETVQNTKIGSIYHKTISGGERKRVSIGVELITDPLLILLDEPTSGLDSFSAFRIVNLLHNLAVKKNKTIISTIHQPSTESFKLFDKLLLMMDGLIVYQGKASDICEHFS